MRTGGQQQPHLTLMADFGCFAWSDSRELRHARAKPGGDLDLSRLGVSSYLQAELTAWHAEWERAAYGHAPTPTDDETTWEERGWGLARQLQVELPQLVVQVWDEVTAQPVRIPDSPGRPVNAPRSPSR